MSIEVLWNNKIILTIEKQDGLYISHVFEENLNDARKTGFPIYFLKQISLVSDELPTLVKSRISNVNNLKSKLKFAEDIDEKEIEKCICEYINETGCRRPTDKFSLKIELEN